jgi:hypothetical protein
MEKSSEYHQRAAECKAFAGRASTLEQQEMLLRMADVWNTLAEDCEPRVAPQKRVADIKNGPFDM